MTRICYNLHVVASARLSNFSVPYSVFALGWFPGLFRALIWLTDWNWTVGVADRSGREVGSCQRKRPCLAMPIHRRASITLACEVYPGLTHWA
jgi:hypothetical protein